MNCTLAKCVLIFRTIKTIPILFVDGSLETVELFVDDHDHVLYIYATDIIVVKDVLHGNDITLHWCMFLITKYVYKFNG